MKFKKIPQRQRAAFPGKYFSDCIFDVLVFNVADRMIKDYSGGHWDYIIFDERIPFMCLEENHQILINPFSSEEVQVPRLIAGMIVTSYAVMFKLERGCRNAEKLSDLHATLNSEIYQQCRNADREDIWMTLMD